MKDAYMEFHLMPWDLVISLIKGGLASAASLY